MLGLSFTGLNSRFILTLTITSFFWEKMIKAESKEGQRKQQRSRFGAKHLTQGECLIISKECFPKISPLSTVLCCLCACILSFAFAEKFKERPWISFVAACSTLCLLSS